MHLQLPPSARKVERPGFVWIAIIVEVPTALFAIPVGISFLTDPTGAGVGIPPGWIEETILRSYLVPGLYLLLVNGLGMLALAGLSVAGHRLAPWLTGALGVGMIIWISVQIAVMPETMFLTWVFLGIGFVLGFVALFWLRRLGHLRLR
jgi:hypothetical protein